MNNSPTSPSVYHRSYHWFGFRQRALKISFIIIIIIVTLVWPAPSANVSGRWRYRFPVWCEPTQAVDGRLAFNDTTLRSGQYRPSLSALNFMRLQTKIAIESLDFGNKDTGLCCMQKGLANRNAKGKRDTSRQFPNKTVIIMQWRQQFDTDSFIYVSSRMTAVNCMHQSY